MGPISLRTHRAAAAPTSSRSDNPSHGGRCDSNWPIEWDAASAPARTRQPSGRRQTSRRCRSRVTDGPGAIAPADRRRHRDIHPPAGCRAARPLARAPGRASARTAC